MAKHSAVRRTSVSAPAVTVVLVAALALAVLGWLLWPSADPGAFRPARATVVDAAACGDAPSREIVVVQTGRGEVRASLNGCGHTVGETIAVEVQQGSDGELVVRLAGTGLSTSAVTGKRLTAVLVVVAAGAAGALAWRLHRRPGG